VILPNSVATSRLGRLAIQAAVLARFVLQVVRQLLALFGFDLIVGEFHDLAADLPQQFGQLTLELKRGGGRGPAPQKSKRRVGRFAATAAPAVASLRHQFPTPPLPQGRRSK
jgi:hypothetical protein